MKMQSNFMHGLFYPIQFGFYQYSWLQQFLYSIGKTERNLATRLSEHSDPQKSSIAKHLSECEHANFYILNLNHIFDNLNDKDTNKPDTPLSRHNLIMANTQTLHTLKHTNSIPSPIP